jgi:hypothetical protein
MANEWTESIRRIGVIQATLGVLRVGKTPDRHTIAGKTSSKWSQSHTVDLAIHFSWLNIDDFIGALEAVTSLEGPDEKIQMIKRIFLDQLGEEMTVGDIVKAFEDE